MSQYPKSGGTASVKFNLPVSRHSSVPAAAAQSSRTNQREKPNSCVLVYIGTIHRDLLQHQQQVSSSAYPVNSAANSLQQLTETGLADTFISSSPHADERERLLGSLSATTTMSSRFSPAVDQNQLVRHFLKTHPEVSEALIKEFLIEHPNSAAKLLRIFRSGKSTTGSKGNKQRRQSGTSLPSNASGLVNGTLTGNESSAGAQAQSSASSSSVQQLTGSSNSGSTVAPATAADEATAVDDDEDGEIADDDGEDALENIRSVAQEIVRKKNNLINYDPTLASTWSNKTNTNRNLDAKLKEHQQYLAEVAALDENELFMELIRDVANELDMEVLCFKVMTNVVTLVGADRGSLFLTRKEGGLKLLVSKLFDVTAESTAAEIIKSKETEVIVPFGKGIVGSVAETKQSINIKDAYS
ncbi:cGMP-specific 3',5'-cyclic phosphodiesterase-like, partial [Paramacrobiotus metropolitanus]|uniref:cGMP-specific 3',5'-cyclic phosphodiesterase-like n=1 Tax=Paramacrobiotus metropolitanus TaxID=2943436 RepID=UPI002445B0FD